MPLVDTAVGMAVQGMVARGGFVFSQARAMTHAKRWTIALLAFAILGCSRSLPTGPVAGDSPPQPIACMAGEVVALPGGFQPTPVWQTVASRTLTPLLGGTVQGSRYKVVVPPLALTQATTISVRQYDPNVIDFELLPHGTQFLLPVTVEIDYAGTSLDPASPSYTGGLPVLLWFNDSTGIWELIPGVHNPLTKKYTVLLSHFSRYCVGKTQGTAEW